MLIVVRGGDSETVSSLAAKQLPTPDVMKLWGDAVFYNPDFISKKVTFFTQYVFSFWFSVFFFYLKNVGHSWFKKVPLHIVLVSKQ